MSSLLYIPCASLTKEDIESLVKLCLSDDVQRVDTHGARKVALKYVLNMHAVGFDLSKYVTHEQIHKLKEQFEYLKQIDLFKKEFDSNHDEKYELYWELNNNSPNIHSFAKNTRQFTNTNGFSPEQLKVYFNTKQIANIPYSNATFQSAGFVDADVKSNLMNFPIEERQNEGIINTKQGRIEQAIFDIPPGKQIIILDFADERMPGGLFLYGARTQEETICYHSDTYRALMDFKYTRFDGGFFIPEFGCLYMKNVKFYKALDNREFARVDVIAGACYDLTRQEGLYHVPDSNEQIEVNTRKKFQTIISAAQANSEKNGKETYLVLGPIGCGAFQNNIHTIAKLWAEVLFEPLNDRFNTQQRHAFQHIWFLSGTEQKLKVFEDAFHLDTNQRIK
ncbi:unnamed protein product [Adineta ricciae]|uniref:Microbial-type PARG catalytic domain-containing protein n=1 Tax=Adineta ricciae TaxID=249248 RepID=A0A815WWA1_ADIRI|nr:unnamed protein product [Adineta ricciae]CAF1622848.1 unnamed protein product [Adineta ricciae]